MCNLLVKLIVMKFNIKISHIQFFYMNAKQQDISSLLGINFQILHCKVGWK
jgi:hypothetical protein